MLSTPRKRFGFTLAVAGALLLVAGILYGDVTRIDDFWRYVVHDYRRYHTGAPMVFYGFWGCALGLFLWIAYPFTLGRLAHWIWTGRKGP